MAECNVPENNMTAVIGAAMRNQRSHALKQFGVRLPCPIKLENSRDSDTSPPIIQSMTPVEANVLISRMGLTMCRNAIAGPRHWREAGD